jgi:hypothetical protein
MSIKTERVLKIKLIELANICRDAIAFELHQLGIEWSNVVLDPRKSFQKMVKTLQFEDTFSGRYGETMGVRLLKVPYTEVVTNRRLLGSSSPTAIVEHTNKVIFTNLMEAAELAIMLEDKAGDFVLQSHFDDPNDMDGHFTLYIAYAGFITEGEEEPHTLRLTKQELSNYLYSEDAPVQDQELKDIYYIKFPKNVFIKDDALKIIKRMNLKPYIDKRYIGLQSKGCEAISLTRYDALIKKGVKLDRAFKETTIYTSYKGKANGIKHLKRYVYMECDKNAIIVELSQSISADKALSINNAMEGSVMTYTIGAFFNRKVTIDDGYNLGNIWVAFYNSAQNKIIHVVIAKGSNLFGAEVESYIEPVTEDINFFSLFSNKKVDLGLSCDPLAIVPNRRTYKLSKSSGQIRYNCTEYLEDDWSAFLYPIIRCNIADNLRSIFWDFQKISQDWDLFSRDNFTAEISHTALSQALKKFPSFCFKEKYFGHDEEAYDEYIISRGMWWLYESFALVTIQTVRPSLALRNDYYPAILTHIYSVFYNTATNALAFPLLASNGELSRLDSRRSNFPQYAFAENTLHPSPHIASLETRRIPFDLHKHISDMSSKIKQSSVPLRKKAQF